MPRASGRVIVVGSSNTDLVVEVTKLPEPGETVIGGDLSSFAGGKGANQAVAAARAGASVVFIGAFGDDPNSRARREDLEAEGVDCSRSARLAKVPGGVAMIAVQRAGAGVRGENAIVVSPGANGRLSARDISRLMPRLTVRDVVLVSLEVPLAAVERAVRLGDESGALVILNPAPYPASSLAPELLRSCRFVTPNEVEMSALAGAPIGSPKARQRLSRLSGTGPTFIVTRGRHGVDVFGAGRYRPAVARPPKVRAIDTVAAGDCFSGCLAARLSQRPDDLDGAIRFAVAASALSVKKRGAQTSLPRRAAIERMMTKR